MSSYDSKARRSGCTTPDIPDFGETIPPDSMAGIVDRSDFPGDNPTRVAAVARECIQLTCVRC